VGNPTDEGPDFLNNDGEKKIVVLSAMLELQTALLNS